jgi:hypothetical protein
MYTIGMITTNHPKRFKILEKAINSIEKLKNKQIRKILSVDEFPQFRTNKEFFDKFSKTGWEVFFKKHTGRNSMVTNQLNLLNKINTEWILYCEDDITFKEIPPFTILEKILTKENGFLSLTGHVHEFPSSETLEYSRNKENYIDIGEYQILKKDPSVFQTKWFLNFPSCFIRKDHLVDVLRYSSNRFAGSSYSIEEGLSYAWFENNMHLKFNSYILLKGLDLSSEDILKEIHKKTILNYWNNDITTQVPPVNDKESMWF